MTGVESLFSEKSEMFSVSDAQTKPDKSMNDKEWDDYLNKIDNVLDFYKQITVEDGKKNLETADKEREENRAVWLEDISKLMQMGQTFVAEKINNENIQEKQKEQELLKNNKNEGETIKFLRFYSKFIYIPNFVINFLCAKCTKGLFKPKM